MTSAGNWLAGTGLIIGLWFLGDRFLALLPLELSRAERLGLGFGLGSGMMAFSIFLVSWFGLPMTGPVIFLLYVLILAGLVEFVRVWPVRASRQAQAQSGGGSGLEPPVVSIVLASTILGLVALAALRSIGLAYHSWDAIALWGAKGYGISKEASIFGAADWGNFRLNYPLQLPILIAVFHKLTGDILPASKLIFPAYYASILGLTYAFLRRTTGSAAFPMLAAAALGSTPIIFQHATIGYANLMLTYFLVAGTVIGIRFVQTHEPGAALLTGVLWGLAVWTRPEAIGFWIALLASMLLYQHLTGGSISNLTRVLWPSLVVVIPWIGFLLRYGTGGTHQDVLRSALSGVMSGQLNLSALYAIVRHFGASITSLEVWGLLLPLAAIGLLLSFVLRPQILLEPPAGIPVLGGSAVGLGVIGLYFATSYSPGLDIAYWLNTGFDRVIMPGVVLFSLGALSAVGKLGSLPQANTEASRDGGPRTRQERETGLMSGGEHPETNHNASPGA